MQQSHEKEKAEATIKKHLDSEKEKFREHIKGKESKFLFVLLQSLNYMVGNRLLTERTGLIDRIDIPTYRVFVSLKAMLDVVLRNRISAVQEVDKDEFLNIFSTFKDHFKIGFLSHMLFIQRAYNVQKIRVKNGSIEGIQEHSEFYEAIQKWVDTTGLDPDWINWYFSKFHKKRTKVGSLLQNEFKRTSFVKLDDLTNISEYFKGVSEEHLQKEWSLDNMRFLYIKRKTLKKTFLRHMSQEDTEKWIRMLEYKPGRDFYKSPLVRVKFRGQKVYTLITSVFAPSNHFWGAWISDLLLDNPELSARGTWASQYGIAFQNYVDYKLKQSGLPVLNLGSRKLTIHEHPEIQPWLDKLSQKKGFEIDRIIKCRDVLFITSCKTTGFLYDRKVIRRGVFWSRDQLERRVERNLQDMKEISVITDCIRSCEKVRKRLDLSASRFVAVLLTSMLEPLSIDEVQMYYSKKKMSLSNTYIVTVPQFTDIIRSMCT